MLISSDGAKVYEGVRTAGETVSYTAEKELLLQTGNAGGFAFKLNGKPGKPPRPSRVRADRRPDHAGDTGRFSDQPATAPAVR